MNTRRLKHLGLFVVLSALISVSGWAQAVHDVTITGTVSTPSGERIPGVTVVITSAALVTGERQVISDQEGRFVFLSLPPGKYDLTADLSGFNKYSAPNIVLHSGEKTDVKVGLRPSAYQEQVTVTAAAPVVDTKSSTVSTTFTAEMLDKLPTARNAFYDLAMGAPGMASVGGNESWLSSPSAYGSAANENVFLVNGVNATNPRGAPWGTLVNVNYNTVEEVKIISLGSKAEYGSFSGAAIDVLTKSGSNAFKGDVAYYSQLGKAANNATLNFGGGVNPYITGERLFYANPADTLTSKPVDSWEGSATFGGPILKDRLWFYGGYDKSKSSTDTPLWIPLATWDQALYDMKLTGDFFTNHRAWLSYHHETSFSGNQTWGQTWDPTMGYDQRTNNNTFQSQYQWVINDRNLASAKYLGFKTNQKPEQTGNLTKPGFINWWKWIGIQSVGTGGNFPYVESYKSDRNTIQADMTHYAAHFLGEHEVKFGVQYTKSHGNFAGGYFQGYANFAYPYPYDYGPAKDWWWNGPESWQWGTDEKPVFPIRNEKTFQHPWLTRRAASEAGGFIDDTWSINDRLTFNVGLRYDRMTAKYGEGALYEFPTTPDEVNNPRLLRTTEGTGNIFDFKTLSPRLGFAYALTEDRRTVLRAHVGRYFAPMGVETLRRFGPDLNREDRETWLYFLQMSEVDLNHNGMIDFNEVRPAYALLPGRKPDLLFRKATANPSWRLDVTPGLKSPYTDQFEISVQRQLGRDYAIEGTAIYKSTKNLIAFQSYNTATGQLWEWKSTPFTTFTGFKTKVWEIVQKDYNGDGFIDVDDAKFVLENRGRRAANISSFDGKSVGRTYSGLQLVFTKRYSARWQALASANWNQSNGFAARLQDQNYYIDGPMIMDNVFGNSYNDFQNNTEGPSPMTPRLMLKLNGSYTIPRIETDFGMRWRFDDGRPFWPVQQLPAFASYMSSTDGVFLTGEANNNPFVASDVKHPDYMPSTSIFDVSLGKGFKAVGATQVWLSFDVLNVLNAHSPNIIGFKQGDYGRVYSITGPRTFRGGVKLLF